MKSIFRILLVLCMMLSLTPVKVSAETVSEENGAWAYVKWANGTKTEYGTFIDAWNAATTNGDNNTVGLNQNWNGGHFLVPVGKTLTLELNGYVLYRELDDEETAGEVIQVDTKAKLTVYGGNKDNLTFNSDKSHSVNVYVANADRYGYTRKSKTLSGGIINGGNSSDGGGGIHMEENTKVYLYNVTIAGNRAGAKTVEFGDGGGIEMDESYGYLYMQDSQVIYNCARYDGGGVHVDQSYNKIEMVRSRIDHNVADDNGGGLYVDGNNFTLKGDAKQIMNPEDAISTYGIKDWTGPEDYFPPVNDEIGSSISYNCCFDAEEGGGGIFCDNQTELIQGVNIFGNIATNTDDDTYGGGIYLDEEEITVRNCNIFRNKCDQLGGGIYNRGDDNIADRDDNTVDSCSIVMNLAWGTGGAGGGIYVYRYCDLNIAGSLIVRGNVSNGLANDNLYLSSDGYEVHSYLIPSTAPGADVHVRLSSKYVNSSVNHISRDPGSYNIQHFNYDNDGGKHIGWNSKWNDRWLKIVDGVKPEKEGTHAFEPFGRTRTQEIVEDYNETGSPLIKGVVSYPSFPNENADIENVFYYSDGFFTVDTNTYNPQLATLSMCLAGAAGYSNEYGKDDHEGGLTSDYLDKSQNFRQFVSDIGCKDVDIFVNDFNTQKPGSDTIGVGIASKDMTFGDTRKKLVIIGVRGMGYEKEWISNMTLGAEKDGEAVGWATAANQIMAELKDYLAYREINGSDENTIFWIAGYSRAGATANLTAKRIVDTYDNAGTHTFAYPMEAPKGGVESAKVAGNNYNCIHNVVNNNDIVPWVGTTEMGLIRYGVDHYVPGSTEISANPSDHDDANKVPVKNNIPEDNVPWDVEDTIHQGYGAQKKKMLEQLTAVNQDILFDDYFQQATVNYISSGLGLEDMITEVKRHEDQIGTTEHFIQFFFEKLQEYAFKYQLNGKGVDEHYQKARSYFAEYKVANNRTFQQAAASMAALIFGKSSEDTDGLIDCFAGLMDRMDTIPDKLRLYGNIDKDDIDDLEKEIDSIWKWLTEVSEKDQSKGYHPIKDYLTDAEYKELSECFKALLFPILCFAGEDYDQWDQDILGTMGYNISRIIANHYPEVTHAWLRSYDDLYKDDTTPIIMADSARLKQPSPVALYITGADGYSAGKTETPVAGQTIEIDIDDIVSLTPSDRYDIDMGEAFYYQFTSGKDHTVHPFSEPFHLKDMIDKYSTNGVFTLKVVAAYNGTKLDPVEFSIKFKNSSIMVVPGEWDSEAGDYSYNSVSLTIGSEYPLEWKDPGIEGQEFRFKRWEAYKYTNDSSELGERIPEDQYIDCFGWDFDPYSAETTIENHSGVSVKFVPVYDLIITSMNIAFSGGTVLPKNALWTDEHFGGIENPVYWRYDAANNAYIGEFSIDLPAGMSIVKELKPSIYFDNYRISNYETLNVSFANQRVLFEIKVQPLDYDGGAAIDSFAQIETRDLNLNTDIETLSFDLTGLETVTAPDQRNMEFVKWENESTDRSIKASEFTAGTAMIAYYRPVINEIDVTLEEAPEGSRVLPEMVSTTVKITNTWKIDNAVMTWRTTDTFAEYNTEYIARITVDKKNIAGTNLDVAGSESTSLKGAFSMAENVNVVVKDESGNPVTLTNYIFSETEEQIILDLKFFTAKQKIVRFAETSVTVSSEDIHTYGIGYGLPEEVIAYLESGFDVSVPVDWVRTREHVDYLDDSTTLIATWEGVYTGDKYDVAEDVIPIVVETITPIKRAAPPVASVSSGDYSCVLTITLSAEDNAEIYYRVVDFIDEVENPLHSPWFYLDNPADGVYTKKYEEPIVLNQYIDNDYYLFAYAKYPGSDYASSAVQYRYKLTQPVLKKLEEKAPTIAKDGNIECWYSTKKVPKQPIEYDSDGKIIYDDDPVPDQYYRDEGGTELLNYENDVVIPAFIRTTHVSAAYEYDAVAASIGGTVIYKGFEQLAVQKIGSDGLTARILTVLDSRIIAAATDYGYLFDTDKNNLTYDTATYKYSCKNTDNGLYKGDYSFVTAKIANGFLDPKMRASFYVKLEDGETFIYTNPITCEATLAGSETTDSAKDNITVEEKMPKFTVHSLVLSGEIGVNFFMDLPEIEGVDYNNSYMEFTVSGKGGKTTRDVFDPSHKNNTDDYYGFTCHVNSIQMAETITAVFHYCDDKTVEQTYSIKRYLQNMDAKGDGLDDTTVKLLRSLADYGHYAQLFLSEKKGWSIGKDYAEMDLYYTDSYPISDVTAAVADYEIVREHNDPDIAKITYALALDSGTDIRVYFKPVSDYSGSFTATVDGKPCDAVKQSDGRYLVTIPGISAHKLGTVYNIVAATDAGSATVKVSALSYVQGMLSGHTDNNTLNAAASIYNYYAAAQAYKDSH